MMLYDEYDHDYYDSLYEWYDSIISAPKSSLSLCPNSSSFFIIPNMLFDSLLEIFILNIFISMLTSFLSFYLIPYILQSHSFRSILLHPHTFSNVFSEVIEMAKPNNETQFPLSLHSLNYRNDVDAGGERMEERRVRFFMDVIYNRKRERSEKNRNTARSGFSSHPHLFHLPLSSSTLPDRFFSLTLHLTVPLICSTYFSVPLSLFPLTS